MSLKLQLNGWKGQYIREVVVDGDLPQTMSAYRVQQVRWSKGSIQCAVKHLPNVWRSRLSVFKKVQASLQLTSYSISLLMFMIFLLAFTVATLGFYALPETHGMGLFKSIISNPIVSSFLTIGTLCIVVYYLAPFFLLDLSLHENIPRMFTLVVLGYGISAICAVSLIEGFFTKGGEFLRVPKNNSHTKVHYRAPTIFSGLETTSLVLCFLGIGFASFLHTLSLISTLIMYSIGFLVVGIDGLTPIWLLNALRNILQSNP